VRALRAQRPSDSGAGRPGPGRTARGIRCLGAVALVLPLFAHTGCTSLTAARLARADIEGFRPSHVDAGPCGWFALVRPDPGRCLATVVVEGDGRAWTTRTRLSPDPTPREPVGLDIALSIPVGGVAYLARPGQYPPDTAPAPTCPPRYWAGARFAPEVVAGADAAIDTLVDRLVGPDCDAPELALVGFSGGGTLAALVTARRADVDHLVTIAANLDHTVWTEHHGVTPLDGSLSLFPVTAALARVPQHHLVGGDDAIVPPTLNDRVIAALGAAGHPRIVVPGADHAGPWVPAWRTAVCADPTRAAAPAFAACPVR